MRIGSVLPALVLGVIIILTMITGMAASPEDPWISGTVVDGDDHPLPGVNVTAENTTSGQLFYGLTGENGTYNLSLPIGVYNITGSMVNYSSNVSYDMMIVNENVAGLNFTMTENLGTVTGFVTNGTAPISGAEIHLKSDECEYTANSTIPLGRFEILDVQPGTYVAHTTKEGYQTNFSDTPVFVMRGETTTVNFNLTEEPATLFGKVVYGGNGLTDVRVDLTSNEFSTTTFTDSNGNYSVVGIPVGNYHVIFTKNDFINQEFEVSLDAHLPKILDVTMEKKAGSGGGFIPGFDLSHSLMVVGLTFAIITMILALFIHFRVDKKPDLIEREEPEQKED